ncbi:unnamed protein product [Ceutorhynchus assimilis]|uniref:Androgen-dependent TFPI-regulating protein n=1 Tax=Ceutorhynchus assimilis TaxID=467358 RepID=A0A9N9MZI0_9CUCU|nr:unnamed protein product [Ceutorhynchus assimilis]
MTKETLLILLLHLSILTFYIYSLKQSAAIRKTVDISKLVNELKQLGPRFENVTNEKAEKYVKEGKYVGLLFFTTWTFILQILFLLLAVSDETSKLANLKSIQKSIEKIRHYLFSTLLLPSTLIVISVFWSIWHIDRELIFPKVIDNFYPSWLNHTLHTFIAVPIIIEMFIQFKNQQFEVSRTLCMIGLTIYCSVYQFLYLSVYFKHGIWLYPIYNVLNWTQRVIFLLAQYSIGLICQQIAITILSKKNIKTKTT